MDSPYAAEIRLALATARLAALLSTRILTATDPGAVEKSDLTPVTVADFAVQALLAATFGAAFPADRLVGEESAAELRARPPLLRRVWDTLDQLARTEGVARLSDTETSAAAAAPAATPRIPASPAHICALLDRSGSDPPAGPGRAWIFDPIDGTANYMRGRVYAINIALLVDGAQALGVVACPNFSADTAPPVLNDSLSADGCVLFAVKGHGTYVVPLAESSEAPRRLPRVRERVEEQNVRFVTCTPAHGISSGHPRAHERIAERIRGTAAGAEDSMLLPWVLRWVALALNVADVNVWIYKEPRRTAKIVDHAGAVLLFQEVGGVVSDLFGRELDLAAGRVMEGNFGFVAAPSGMHAEILAQVREVLGELGLEGHLALANH